MTKQEIGSYLKKYSFMVFRYNSECYSLKRSRFLFSYRYGLIATDGEPCYRNSLEELFEQVYIGKDTLLIDAVKYIEIPEASDAFWETYEAVRHCAIIYGSEIHFSYNEKSYWIAHTCDGLSHLSDDFGNTQMFNSCRDLFEHARIEGDTLKDIWIKVVVDAC